jgi:enhancer of polycomb-like protein
MATRKVRYKKLSIKTALPVLREGQIDPSEYESLATETQIATGVEQAEENVREKLYLSQARLAYHVHPHVPDCQHPNLGTKRNLR